ncbi:unnamed protein product [Phytophthora lilii]|uniref:Unnamed protein product n=1 Tax=Phytophthora lilii TaxID=2077276 RepID=A0A9W6TSA2_9STRA|nr:unnamed protein product [Phytophthora lilii]
MRLRRVATALVALLVAGAALGDVETGSASNGDSNAETTSSGSKKTRSFVKATHGSANSLTLTTFLTDAAHLHYAVLPAGLPPLDAAAVKTAAAQCRVDVSEERGGGDRADAARRLPGRGGAVERLQTAGAVAADTVTVPKAQKVVIAVENLLPNTSYDVYFVAEVIGSNGVFGPVQSVLQSSTHPEPPEIDVTAVLPANASADMVLINAAITTPGRVYFALVPAGSNEDVLLLTREDLAQNRSVRTEVDVVEPTFALHTIPLGANGSYTFQKVVGNLAPATLYDVFVMTEAPGSGEVCSEVARHAKAVRTHALAPEISALNCAPFNASATAVDIKFKLDIHQQDVHRARLETLPYFRYDLHYEVIALSDGAASKKQGTITSSAVSASAGTTATRSTDDISALRNTTIRGMFSLRNFSSVEDFHAGLTETHHANITGLQSGTLYKVKLRAETSGSHGLFGLRELTAQAKTHETAPIIHTATVQAKNRTVNSLTLTVGLARSRGNIHYVLTGKGGSASNLRSVFQQATNVGNLNHLLRERFSRDFDESDYVTGVFKFNSEERVRTTPDTSIPDSRTKPGKTEDVVEEYFQQQFEIGGLQDATSYSIALLPETTKSFGVFGRAFNTLLEAATNENASEVELRSAKPLRGNISAIELEVRMTKPKDVLFLCLDEAIELTENAANVTASDSDSCREVENRENAEISRGSSNVFTFTVGNLKEDTNYQVSLYAENARRNGVLSSQSDQAFVQTHKSAPNILETSAQPTPATTSQVTARVVLEPISPCILHYVVREAQDSTNAGMQDPVSADAIVEHSSERGQEGRPHFQHRLPPSSSSFVTGGNTFADSRAPDATTAIEVKGLSTNKTYELFVVTETSRDGNSSGVLGEPAIFNVTTHAIAPKIVLATVDPVGGSTDSVVISTNLSYPGIVHYFLSDVDFADPAIISDSDEKRIPHELRGQFMVLEEHILMEVINGTNDTRPTEPNVFVHNSTVGGLKSGTTYHVSLTTETYDSNGVFGEFPPPVLVNTHLGPPVIIPEKLSVLPVDGTSSALAMDFQLDRFGDVHYALFFRGLVPDRSRQFDNSQIAENKPEAASGSENGGNDSVAIWPPPVSTFDLTQLNGLMLKEAKLEELGIGVWVNDTISVSREDVLRGKMTHKKIEKLPANALFDVCLVSETAASGGILGWPANGSTSACHRIITHADYTNQSTLFDEISVHALEGRTDGICITLKVSKLLEAPQTTAEGHIDVVDRFAAATGRVPYFVLLDANAKSGRDVGGFLSHRGEITSAFKDASPGRGGGVVAAGMLGNITAENDTALRIDQDVLGLDANREYLLYFAYETSNSGGVFTRVNPHKHKSNDTRAENDGIPVTTHEAAPRISNAKAQPSFGHISRVTVKFDVACDSCKSALVHLLVFPDGCKFPQSVSDTLRLNQFYEMEMNVTINASSSNEQTNRECEIPLVQRRVEFEMSERQRNRKDLEEELGGDNILLANTSYIVLLATETVGSQGVLSEKFEEQLYVRTHDPAPSFTELRLEPRTGSTTELLLAFALDRPGEVHYMLGASDNAEFNVTSPHNISSKGIPNGDRHGRGKDSHDYRQEVVRMRRSVTYSDGEHVELLDYLMPGTSYTLFIVSEALPADHGVYGSIHDVKEVSTFANAPILLAHTAYPTPGTTQALTVGFRMDAPGIIYFSAVAIKPWELTHHVAKGSDRYGNRLALQDQLVAQKSLEVVKESMESESDTGWREQILEVPESGLNHTVYIVTETKNSGGIYGIVASHSGVRAHSKPPKLTSVHVSPTDARVDSLTVNISLSDRGHVHYIALPSGRGTKPPSDDLSHQSTELSILASGSVDINETAGNVQETSFTITGLTEGTSYDLFFRAETFESFGVFGAWSQPRTPKIKINGIKRNPNLHLSEMDLEYEESLVHESLQTDSHDQPTQPVDLDAGVQDAIEQTVTSENLDGFSTATKETHGASSKMQDNQQQEEVVESVTTETFVQEPIQEEHPSVDQMEQAAELNPPDVPDPGIINVGLNDQGLPQGTYEEEPLQETTGCPLNAQATASGLCECIPGYEVDEGGNSCVLSRMATAAEVAATATSAAFDVLNAHRHAPSQSA